MPKKLPMIEVKFTNFSDMCEIENILGNANINASIFSGDKYYETYSESAVMDYKGSRKYLYFLIDKSGHNYKIMCNESDHIRDEYICEYPVDREKFRCLILTPIYKGRSIKKS